MAMTYATRAEAGSSLLKAMSGGYRRYIKNKKPFVEILYERLFYGAQGICTIHAEKQITPFDGLSAFCFSHLPARIFLTVFFSMLRLHPLASSESPFVTTLTAACVPKSVSSKQHFAQHVISFMTMTEAESYVS